VPPVAESTARYLPFLEGRYRMAMGLQPLAAAEWIEIDDYFGAQLAEKRRLLAQVPDEIVIALPAAQAAADELLALLAAHLCEVHGTRFARDGAHVVNRVTDERWNVASPERHPLELCGRLVQEDFCLLQRAGGHHALVAGSLCFPSKWRLADKIGHPIAAVHGPVPGYGAALARPVDRFFDALKPDRLVWRLNWLIHDDPTLFQQGGGTTPPTPDATQAGDALWLRVERQTLRRLPQTDAVVFTIRTHVTPLRAAITTPEQAAALASAVRSMPPDVVAYRHMGHFVPPLLAWLDDFSARG
jgi:hypothetical protein